MQQIIIMNINVAIPILKNRVAPCFEAATSFVISAVSNRQVISRKTVSCSGSEGYRRVRLLKVYDVDILLCNGIEGFYFDLLSTINITVIPDISGSANKALENYLSGKLTPPDNYPDASSETHNLALCDLVNWAKAYFEQNGYEVKKGPCTDALLIDLIAEIVCPVCGKPVKVALCCGAHTYRTDQEIREFNYCTRTGYHARVFVFPGDEKIAQLCREYGIELIRPTLEYIPRESPAKDKIPILRFPVEGHTKNASRESW
ncbi:MAG: NifB/NifX family molybdenum-iron cluster-binding protein [candidate division Zixibacteria bacterium]|nr:NifB/NifX family molybdenum-iron cluster-binding protein [candidate division Zixibacteria bacterium]